MPPCAKIHIMHASSSGIPHSNVAVVGASRRRRSRRGGWGSWGKSHARFEEGGDGWTHAHVLKSGVHRQGICTNAKEYVTQARVEDLYACMHLFEEVPRVHRRPQLPYLRGRIMRDQLCSGTTTRACTAEQRQLRQGVDVVVSGRGVQ